MELDSRIIEGKKPLDCFDVSVAKEFIGKECYFSDSLSDFLRLSCFTDCPSEHRRIGTLRLVSEIEASPFYLSDLHSCLYILPCEWVKEEKKESKYRPFTGIEFAEKFDLKLGGIIRLKHIITQYRYKTIFTGYRWNGDDFEVFLNGDWINMLTLLNTYEYDEDNEWKKFGVEV